MQSLIIMINSPNEYEAILNGTQTIIHKPVNEVWARKLYDRYSRTPDGKEWKIKDDVPKHYDCVEVMHRGSRHRFKYDGFKVSIDGDALVFKIRIG